MKNLYNEIVKFPHTIILFIVSIPYIWFVFWRIGIHLEINGNESWNAYHIKNAFNVAELYPPLNHMINNYTPLSYYLLHLIDIVIGNPIITGRIVSTIAIFAMAFSTFSISKYIFKIKSSYAIFASLWLIATMFRGFVGYAGMNDPHLLGLSVMIFGFYHFLKYRRSRWLYCSIFIMIIAGLVKNSLFAFPISAGIILLIERNERLVRVVLFSIIVISIICLMFYSIYGSIFFDQLLIPREIKPIRIIQSAHRLQWVIIPLSFWIYWLKISNQSELKNISKIIVITSTFVFFITGMAEGVGTNAIFELVFATSLCVALALDVLCENRFNKLRLVTIFAVLNIIRIIGTLHNDPYYLLFSSEYRLGILERSEQMNREIVEVRKLNDPVTCSISTVCFLAEKKYNSAGHLIEQSPNGKWAIVQ